MPGVIEDLGLTPAADGPDVRAVFLADGNSAALAAEGLVAIGDAAWLWRCSRPTVQLH
jgi:hypothetical protein